MLRADFGQVGVSFGCFGSQGGAMDTRWSSPTNVVTGETRSSAWPLDIARSLIARAVVVGVDDGAEQEILLYDEVVARFGRAPGFELRQETARALLAKGAALGRLNRTEEEILAYEAIVGRLGHVQDPCLLELVAHALGATAAVYERLHRTTDAIAVWNVIVDRFEAAPSPVLRRLVACSRYNVYVAERPPVERYTRLFHLPDGRTMAYSDLGDPCGRPWLHLHGIPSCRLETVNLHPWALCSGVRLITPDRPGFGLSSPSLAPGHAAWAQDARLLLDHLGITELAAVGGSGGAGYAMAVAWALPERVRAVVLLSGACPWDRTTAHEAALVTRAFHSPLSRPLRAVMRHGARRVAELHTEEEVLGGLRGSKREWTMAVMTEAVRQGDVAYFADYRRAGTWDFPFTSVAQPVRIWHGASDRRASVRLARRLAASLSDAEIVVVPGGHGSSFEGWHAWLHAQLSLPGRPDDAGPCSRPSHDADQVEPAGSARVSMAGERPPGAGAVEQVYGEGAASSAITTSVS